MLEADALKRLGERFDTADDWNTFRYDNDMNTMTFTGPDGQSQFWPAWAERQHWRIKHGVYRTSDVLDAVNNMLRWAFVHVSVEDPKLIAYTPDAAFGNRDKTLSMSLGKFLVKHFPVYRDEYIQSLVAQHYADLDLVIHFYTDEDNITDVYLNGPNSCMKKGVENYPRTGGLLPISLYANVPGLALAVIRDADGVPKARTLVRPDQKIAIRYYGDTKLQKALAKQGYQFGSHQGLVYPAVFIEAEGLTKGHRRVLMPYLDRNGGPGDSNNDKLLLVDDKILVLTPEELRKAKRKSMNLGHGVVTGGVIDLYQYQMGDWYDIDVLTGEALTVDYPVWVWYAKPDGTWGEGKTNATPEELAAQGYIQAAKSRFSSRGLWATEAQTFLPDARSGYTQRMIETDENREQTGYHKMSERYYPGLGWTYTQEAYTTHDGEKIARDDAMYIISHDAAGVLQARVFHRSEGFPAGSIKVHSRFRGMAEWADEGVKVVKTLQGRKVVPGHHDVKELYDGTWEFRTKLRRLQHFGKWFYYVSTRPEALNAGSDYLKKAFVKALDEANSELAHASYANDRWLVALFKVLNDASWNYGQIVLPEFLGNRHEYMNWHDYPWKRITRRLDNDENMQDLRNKVVYDSLMRDFSQGEAAVYRDAAIAWVEEHKYLMVEANAQNLNGVDSYGPDFRHDGEFRINVSTFLDRHYGGAEMTAEQEGAVRRLAEIGASASALSEAIQNLNTVVASMSVPEPVFAAERAGLDALIASAADRQALAEVEGLGALIAPMSAAELEQRAAAFLELDVVAPTRELVGEFDHMSGLVHYTERTLDLASQVTHVQVLLPEDIRIVYADDGHTIIGYEVNAQGNVTRNAVVRVYTDNENRTHMVQHNGFNHAPGAAIAEPVAEEAHAGDDNPDFEY